MEKTKPTVKLTGENGNVFNLIGLTKKALVKAGLRDEGNEFVRRAYSLGSYNEVLNLISEYCEVE